MDGVCRHGESHALPKRHIIQFPPYFVPYCSNHSDRRRETVADNQHPNPESQSLEGVELRPKNSEEVANAVDLAFDYRGDVTIQLQSGEVIEGYVFDRHAEVHQPFLQFFPKDLPGTRKIFYQDIAAVIFSGEDTAFGKSWQDWVKKKSEESERLARRSEIESN